MNRHEDSAPDRLRRMAASDELGVGRGRSEQLARRAMARAAARPVRRTLAAALAGSAFAIVSVAGLGAVADQAAPGDPLYAIDRAYESVTSVVIGPVDRSEERMIEALALIQRGDRQAAVDHLTVELTFDDPVEVALPVVPVAPDDLAAVEVDPVSTTTTVEPSAPAATTGQPASGPAEESATPVELVDDDEDPLVLAIEYALQAKQAAKDTDDEAVTAEAETAVRSVLQLAIAPVDAQLVAEEESGTVAAADTSTTTTVNEDPNRGNGPPGRGNTTTTTTTTSVPGEDLSQQGSDGTDDSTGDTEGDTREGAGGSTEPGDGDSGNTGPLILPIP